MTMQIIEPGKTLFAFHRPAFGRSDFVEKFCAKNNDDRTAPIGDGVAKKRAQMRFRIEQAIADYPDEQKGDGHNAEGMTVKETMTMAAATTGHGVYHDVLTGSGGLLKQGAAV